MKKIIFNIFLLITTSVSAQINLILNPSCENFSSCPSSLDQLNLLNDISNPNISSPDFFHTCYTNSNNQAKVPSNIVGYQQPQNGNAYCGISPFNFSINGREYVTFHLSDTLDAGKNYKIAFYISLADSMKHTTDKIGAYLHSNFIFQNDYYYLPYQPQIENASGNFITDKINWIKIEGEYIAGGGEKYITIGNFYPDSLTDTISLNNNPISGSNWAGAYFYIDDVSVTEILDTTSTIEIPNFANGISIYPNPAQEIINIEVKNEEEFNYQIEIIDLTGKILLSSSINARNKSLDISELSAGIYYIIFENNSAIIESRKLAITK